MIQFRTIENLRTFYPKVTWRVWLNTELSTSAKLWAMVREPNQFLAKNSGIFTNLLKLNCNFLFACKLGGRKQQENAWSFCVIRFCYKAAAVFLAHTNKSRNMLYTSIGCNSTDHDWRHVWPQYFQQFFHS